MMTSTQILPGIKFIGWIDCRNLPDRVDLMGICGMPVAILTDIHKIPFFDEPECQCVTKKEIGYEDTASLKFCTPKRLPKSKFLAFVITDVNGKSFLIGSKEQPFAKTEPTRRTGLSSSEPAGIEYQITHVAIRSMVPCVI